MHVLMQDRRGKLGWEAIIVICVTGLGWASTAGMMWQHISDMDARLVRIEQKVDAVRWLTGEVEKGK